MANYEGPGTTGKRERHQQAAKEAQVRHPQEKCQEPTGGQQKHPGNDRTTGRQKEGDDSANMGESGLLPCGGETVRQKKTLKRVGGTCERGYQE